MCKIHIFWQHIYIPSRSMGHICNFSGLFVTQSFMTNFSLYYCSQRFFFLLLLFPFETLLSYFINGPKNRAWHFFSPAGVWAINYGALNRDFVIHSWKHPFKFWLLWLLQCAVETKSKAVAWEPIQVLQSCAKILMRFPIILFTFFSGRFNWQIPRYKRLLHWKQT